MENRIKEQQLWLFADRTSTATMRANQLRLTFATFAGVLMTLLRQVGLSDTALAGARADTIRAPAPEGRRPHHRQPAPDPHRGSRPSTRCRSCSPTCSRTCAHRRPAPAPADPSPP